MSNNKPTQQSPLIDPLKGLVGNTHFSALLEALAKQYLFTANVSANGEQAMRSEGERAMLVNLVNVYDEVSNNVE